MLPSPALMPRDLPPDQFEREVTTDLKDQTKDKPRGLPLHTRIVIGLLAGLVAGLAANMLVGGDHPAVAWTVFHLTEPVGTLFLRLLLMIVIPLVFSSLVTGVAGVGDIRQLGRVGLKTFAYTIVLSAISVVIGLTLANTIRPGKRIDAVTAQGLAARYSDAAARTLGTKPAEAPESPLMQVVKTIVPSNPVAAVATETPNMLYLMFFALVVGIALTLLDAASGAPLVRVLQSVYEVTAKVVDLIKEP